MVSVENPYRTDVAVGGSTEFEDLSKDAVYQAKRFLLDSFGCALGGFQQHDVAIALEVLHEVAGRGAATVIGSGDKMIPYRRLSRMP